MPQTWSRYFWGGILAAFVLASWIFAPADREPRFIAAAEDAEDAPSARRPRSRVRQAAARILPSRDGAVVPAVAADDPFPVPAELAGADLSKQTAEQAHAKSWGCIECHAGAHDPHGSRAIHIGCTDCHGGDANTTVKERAHVHPRFPDVWLTSGNPIRTYTVLNHERPEFIQFVNPGDLRVAHLSCGTANCHPRETLEVKKSMMTHGCMLWGAALYNNGAVPFKWPRYGESYSMHGKPQRLQTVPPPTPYEMEYKGVLPFLDPLPRFGITHPGNVLRIFERGGRFEIEDAIPERMNESGKPLERLGARGLGTLNRTDPVFVGLQKTRLFDPTLNFLGTNEHPGDYRSSGCTACHMVYANDRSPVHSGPYAKYGNRGRAAPATDAIVQAVDPTIPKDEPGHPIHHRFTRAIPTSQCMVCHMHPGTTVLNSYLGYMWWDLEADGEHLWPEQQQYPTAEEYYRRQMSDPNDTVLKSNLRDPEFLARLAELNPLLRHTQFADFHGHGWAFSAVFKKDEDGTPLDRKGRRLEDVSNAQMQLSILIPQYVKQLYLDRDAQDPEVLRRKQEELDRLCDSVPVHMLDIHLEKGMHCIDCHFVQDVHGDTKLYGEVRAAIEITCVDCHGDITRRAPLVVNGRPQMRTSGPAAAERGGWEVDGRDLTAMRTPFGKLRFEMRGDKVIQNSMVEPNLSWEVTQVQDTIDPAKPHYNALSALAKTVRFDEEGEYVWGDVPDDPRQCAHSMQQMNCIACHTAWNPSCFGCHLPQKADKKMPELHNEGEVSLNYVSYNFQTLRDEVYMLARDGIVTGSKIGPSRSSCAIHVTSYNKNRESIYTQQQTISADGMSGIAFSTNVPHTVRGRGETKMCADCHLSDRNDNNAKMAQLLMHGTNFVNFIGRFAWVGAGDHGIHAVAVTEREEPQTVIGSTLHKLAYPDHYKKHLEKDLELQVEHEHPGNDIIENITRPFKTNEVLKLQVRGEFLYAACGENGVRIYDVAFIDHKGFSERFLTAPVSPIGQRLYVRTKYATDVAAPTTIAPDPTRAQNPANREQAIHPLYANIYATDKYEGLIVIGVGTLLDGNPLNNFLKRSVTFNPGGILNGAKAITIVGTYAYICCDAGLVVVCLEDPEKPYVTHVVDGEHLKKPRAVAVQFRYGFVCDEEGVKVLDTTHLAHPEPVAEIEIEDAHNVYVARTYAYVAGGKEGLIILDVKDPTQPKIDQIYNAGGKIKDLHDVKLGITYASQFAYLADGEHGMHVLQLTCPDTPGYNGFSPRPAPRFIATFEIPKGGHALAISKGVDRDRAVDESGNQLAVFGRVGARPLNLEEQQRLYLRRDGTVWRVRDNGPDYTIRDPRERELRLHEDVELFYGPARPYRTPRRSPVPVPAPRP